MAAYKTPGVYVEEIVKFPPSVAQVETAIPAFIGYTEKAEKKNGDSLALKPTRITSLLEYETFFGTALKEDSIEVDITDKVIDGNVERTYLVKKPGTPKPYLMYYSLQMYFANGGGPCYIVSVGDYSTEIISKDDLSSGLAAIRKEDEPTLLLFPDATKLGNVDDFYGLYNDALTQCNELQDRFTIIDTKSDDESADPNPVENLRDKISNDKDYIKYGAAYYPFLDTILDYHYDESNVTLNHTQEADASFNDELAAAEAAATSVSDDKTAAEALVTALDTLNTDIDDGDAANAVAKQGDASNAVQAIIDNLASVITAAESAVTAANNAGVTDEATALNTAITTGDFGTLKTDLEGLKAGIDAAANGTAVKAASDAANTKATEVDAAIAAVHALIDPAIVDAIEAIVGNSPFQSLDGKKLSEVETTDNAAYNTIKAEIGFMPLPLPPSSAIAGVYARVDSDRGVWKAPANVSLNYVVKPTVQISHEDQRDLNVDTIAGKSVNAIRSFTGKGTLVWGARTLAGNDNEWRYVSVRRFFNMAEESIKKATEQFVFEPNDKNTWVRVKAMINNFLTAQWRAGALAGPTPDKAFYVNIGLGETMTAVDILEGNMIVEIGMAVVRPAEFIILKFSHKMQEA
jgi:phage tail sheath protein FI